MGERQENSVKLLKRCLAVMPPEIVPEGLDVARRRHLFREIREFCTLETQDIVCPDPDKDRANE